MPETGAWSATRPAAATPPAGLACSVTACARVLPYLVGAAMFGVAVWVLHSALRRYDLADLHAELAELTLYQVGLAILFTFASFLALIGYEWSALGLSASGCRSPIWSLASFATQSIAHSTGFAFVIGATLRYHFYSDRGLGIADVAKVQMFFTATFTLGVATLAGGVVMIEPWRLAAATGLPPWLWRLAAATALALVIAYVVWGGFFHRPLRWRGRELILPERQRHADPDLLRRRRPHRRGRRPLRPAAGGAGPRLPRGAGRVHGLDRGRPDQPRPGQPRRVRIGGRPAAAADRGADPAADRLAAGLSRRLLPAAAGVRRGRAGRQRAASLARGARRG